MATMNDRRRELDLDDLDRVVGGASRVTARSGSDQLTSMLSQITDSIHSLSNQRQGCDPMQMPMVQSSEEPAPALPPAVGDGGGGDGGGF